MNDDVVDAMNGKSAESAAPQSPESATSPRHEALGIARQAIENQIDVHAASLQQPCEQRCQDELVRKLEMFKIPFLYFKANEELQAFIVGLSERTDQTDCPLLGLKQLREQVQRRIYAREPHISAQHDASDGISKKRPCSPISSFKDNHDFTKRQALPSHFTTASGSLNTATYVKPSNDIRSDGFRSALVSHQLKDLTKHGFGEQPKLDLTSRPWPVSWELSRAIVAKKLDFKDAQSIKTYEDLKNKLDQHKNAMKHPKLDLSNALAFRSEEDEDETEPAQLTLSASITLNKINVGPLFKTTLSAIKPDKHCRAQRRWGWDRLLYVSLETTLPEHIQRGNLNWNDCLVDWLAQPHRLLGRTWRAFHIEDYKKQKSGKSKIEFAMKRIVFFNTEGGDRPIEIERFVNWMVPFKYNSEQLMCKAASRFDLALSRTRKSIVFDKHQIEVVDDMLPTTDCDEMPYKDPNFKHDRPLRVHDWNDAMTDGCGIISVGAAILVCESLKINSHPSAFQARIFGSKGMWIVSDSYDTGVQHHLDVWIQIRKSQLKVSHGEGSVIDPFYLDDETLRSFDVHGFNTLAKTADLHRDFLAILIDRGVKPKAILDMVGKSLRDDSDDMLQACCNPEELAIFVHKGAQYTSGLNARSGLPKGRGERLLYFLSRGGFLPTHCDFMAKLFQAHCCQYLLDDVQKMRIRCEESTILFGVPDPTGLLEPGEIHVTFSSALRHAGRRTTIKDLAGKQVIVARDPTLHASDMQKYDCVYHRELSHLHDVVVFSSKGNMPAASRHQGGDYDGDRFILLWSQVLVDNFLNAPVLQPKSAHELGVTQKTQKLGDLAENTTLGSRAHCEVFLREAFKFRIEQNLLGVVTNFFYTATYNKVDIQDKVATDLVDLHDLLVDSVKQGYVFTSDDFRAFKELRKLSYPDAEPLYKSSIAKLSEGLETNMDFSGALKTACDRQSKTFIADDAPMLDKIYFTVKLPEIEKTITRLGHALRNALKKDEDLMQPLRFFKQVYPDQNFVQKVVKDIEDGLKEIDKNWSTGFADLQNKRLDLVQAAYDGYRAIEPPRALLWMEYNKREGLCTPWDELCASIFYNWSYQTSYAQGKSNRLFSIAGKALCQIKSTSGAGMEVVKLIASLQRIRRRDQSSAVLSFDSHILATQSTDEDEFGTLDDAFDDLVI